ncbi:hypothetical protein EMCRGX_G001172 [Ephydatia muelleri]
MISQSDGTQATYSWGMAAFVDPRHKSLEWLKRHQQHTIQKQLLEEMFAVSGLQMTEIAPCNEDNAQIVKRRRFDDCDFLDDDEPDEQDTSEAAAGALQRAAVQGEYDAWLLVPEARVIDANSPIDPLAWRKMHDGQFPPIAKLARKYLAIPASSAPSERVFSRAKLIQQRQRWDLLPQLVNVKAPLFEPETRVPIDVVAVIDVSGSMAGSKLERVKKTLLFVIGQLKECDRFSLVTYDTNVYLKFELIKMTQDKAIATSTVEAIRAGSSTNLCGGLLKGMEEIAYNSGSEKAKVQSVLLLTDGLANQGVRTKDGILAEMMRIQNPQGEKVAKQEFDGTVYTFGFGADHDAGMLAAISTQGGGVYYFIDTNEKVRLYLL